MSNDTIWIGMVYFIGIYADKDGLKQFNLQSEDSVKSDLVDKA